MFLKMSPSDAIDENLFQWVHLPAHSRFSLTFRKASSWVKDWSSERPRMAAPCAIEYLLYIFLRLLR